MRTLSLLPAFLLALPAAAAAASDGPAVPVIAIAADVHLHFKNRDPGNAAIALVERRREGSLLQANPNLAVVEPAVAGDPRPVSPAGLLTRLRKEGGSKRPVFWHTDACGGVWREEDAGIERRFHPIHVGYLFTTKPDGTRACALIRNETELEKAAQERLAPPGGGPAPTVTELLQLPLEKPETERQGHSPGSARCSPRAATRTSARPSPTT